MYSSISAGISSAIKWRWVAVGGHSHCSLIKLPAACLYLSAALPSYHTNGSPWRPLDLLQIYMCVCVCACEKMPYQWQSVVTHFFCCLKGVVPDIRMSWKSFIEFLLVWSKILKSLKNNASLETKWKHPQAVEGNIFKLWPLLFQNWRCLLEKTWNVIKKTNLSPVTHRDQALDIWGEDLLIYFSSHSLSLTITVSGPGRMNRVVIKVI